MRSSVTRRNPIVPVLLALLLLLMQQGALLHALEHDGDRLRRAHDSGIEAPTADTACALCALFAGGAHAAPAAAPSHPPAVVEFGRAPRATALVAAASPSPYRSRAPPLTL
jgi:hypothetical protein